MTTYQCSTGVGEYVKTQLYGASASAYQAGGEEAAGSSAGKAAWEGGCGCGCMAGSMWRSKKKPSAWREYLGRQCSAV